MYSVLCASVSQLTGVNAMQMTAHCTLITLCTVDCTSTLHSVLFLYTVPLNVSTFQSALCSPSHLYCSIVFTVPLEVNIVPKSNEPVKVKVEEGYQISCNITGDSAPTNTSYNPWRHSDTPVVTDAGHGITVTTVSLQDTIGIQSTIVFAKVTQEQLGDYICAAGERKEAVITLAASGGK